MAGRWLGAQRPPLAEAYCSVLSTPTPFPAFLLRWPVPPPSHPPPISTCMAAIPQWKRAIGFGKQLSDHISAGGPALPRRPPASAAPAAARRGVHASVYDKNPEENVRPALVPDDVIQQHPAGKYWGPHPSTGVFGPADTDGRRPAPASAAAASPGNGGSCGTTTTTSVLDQKVWFRPLEGVDTHLA